MSEQLSMSDILGPDKPAPKEPAAPAEPAEPAAAPDAAAEATAKAEAEERRRQDYTSRRNKAREKEAIAQGKVRDPDTGQFVSPKEAPAEPAAKAEPAKAEPAKPAAPAAAPQQEFTDKEKAFMRAALEERGKRQELERQMTELRAKLPQEPEKKFWDDPEAALAAHESRIRAETQNARLGMAEFTARQKHPDFDEKIAVFAKVLETTPGLHAQWLASPDPAEFAYSLGKNHQELQEVGSMDALRAKIEKETRIKLEAELKEKADLLAKERAALPPSLSEARTGGVPNKPVWSGPPSMKEILEG